jgi:hypothetical protein
MALEETLEQIMKNKNPDDSDEIIRAIGDRIRKLGDMKEGKFIPKIPKPNQFVNYFHDLGENINEETIQDIKRDNLFHENLTIIKRIRRKGKEFRPYEVPVIPLADYKRLRRLTFTPHRELSIDYAARIATMDKRVTAQQLNDHVYKARTASLVGCIIGLGERLADKESQPNRALRDKVKLAVQKYEAMFSGDMPTGWVLDCDIPKNASVQIFDPKQNSGVLDGMLHEAGACTKSSQWSEMPTHADAFTNDSREGGSVHFIYRRGLKAAYGRIYIAIDKKGEPLAFFDCVEAQDLSRSDAKTYVANHEEDILAGVFAAGVEITKRLGLNRLALGDYEITELGRDLSYPEKRIFENNGDNTGAKLGYKGAFLSMEGPAMWKMNHGTSFRVLDIDLYADDTFDYVAAQTAKVMQRLYDNPKSVKMLRKDYETYFGVALEIAEHSNNPDATKLAEGVKAFCDEYKITPREIQTVDFSGLERPDIGYGKGKITGPTNLEKIKDKNKMPYFKKTHQGLLPMASSSSF